MPQECNDEFQSTALFSNVRVCAILMHCSSNAFLLQVFQPMFIAFHSFVVQWWSKVVYLRRYMRKSSRNLIVLLISIVKAFQISLFMYSKLIYLTWVHETFCLPQNCPFSNVGFVWRMRISALSGALALEIRFQNKHDKSGNFKTGDK